MAPGVAFSHACCSGVILAADLVRFQPVVAEADVDLDWAF